MPPSTEPPERHLLPDSATTGPGGHLWVGGLDLLDLAAEYGTPIFVYDEEHLRARCREAVAAWGDGVAYATKAFLCLAMARLAHEEGMWLDVSTDDELARALRAGVGRIVVDSFDEIERLSRLLGHEGRDGGRRQAVMVRVTP